MPQLDVEECWSTPIGTTNIEMSLDMRATLTRLVELQDPCKTSDTYDGRNTDYKKFEAKVYNLFDYKRYDKFDPFEIKAVSYLKKFERAIADAIRAYIFQAWNLEDAEIKVRAFGNVMKTYSRRIPPHFHHGWDGVTVTYLSVGNEFKAIDEIEQTPKDTDFSGNLIMQDPRPAINFPFTDKAKVFKPSVGLTVIHPAYVWHETEVHTRAGLRSCIVVDFKILSQNCDHLPTPLIN